MGVRIRKDSDGVKVVVARCDHNGCNKTATRRTKVRRYNRKSGYNKVTRKDPERPFPYWREAFSGGRNPFHLKSGLWPEEVKAYCDAHDPPEETEPEETKEEMVGEPAQLFLFED